MMLMKYARPRSLCDLEVIFHIDKTIISKLITELTLYIDRKWAPVLLHRFHKARLQSKIPAYARGVAERLQVANSSEWFIWGFVDGTFRKHARNQNQIAQALDYNGHYRGHGYKFQSVVSACGIIEHLFGPINGSRHDAFMMHRSKLTEAGLAECCDAHGVGRRYFIYGDSAYANEKYVMAPFKGSILTTYQRDFNYKMSRVRVSVEWGYALITQIWRGTEVTAENRPSLQPLGSTALKRPSL
jgi:hypothetical protein